MRAVNFARRTGKEILRDPLNIFFGLGFPLVVLFLLTAIQKNVPAAMFDLESLTPGQGRAYFLRLYQESFPETETAGPAFAGPAVEADGTSLTQ